MVLSLSLCIESFDSTKAKIFFVILLILDKMEVF